MSARNESIRGLLEDRKTDWIPDVLGSLDLIDLSYDELHEMRRTRPPGEPIEVALANRHCEVWRIDPVWRAELHVAVDHAIFEAEQALPSSVYGNRDAATPYILEFRRMRDEMSACAEEGQAEYVAIAYVRRFAESITLKHLQGVESVTPEVQQIFQQLYFLGGRVLVHGVRACSRIANLVLTPIDRSIRYPYQRWMDEYRIFTPSKSSAEGALARLSSSLGKIGLSLNHEKTRIVKKGNYIRWAKRDASRDDRLLLDRFRDALSTSDDRVLRYTLPRLHGQVGRMRADEIVKVATERPNLLPRLAVYLDRTVEEENTRNAIAQLVRSNDSWTIGRVLPVVLRHGALIKDVAKGVQGLINTNSAGVGMLAIRVVQIAGLDIKGASVPQREHNAFNQDPLGNIFQPSVATSL